jgi:hypothetical protein
MNANRIFVSLVAVILLLILLAGFFFGTPPLAGASSLDRSNGCRTYNTHAHQDRDIHGRDAEFCTVSGPQVTLTDESETVATQPPITETTVVVSTPHATKPPVKPTIEATSVPTDKPELPTMKPPTKPEETPAAPICKNPQDGRDDNIGDCNAGNGND